MRRRGARTIKGSLRTHVLDDVHDEVHTHLGDRQDGLPLDLLLPELKPAVKPQAGDLSGAAERPTGHLGRGRGGGLEGVVREEVAVDLFQIKYRRRAK